MMDEVVREAQSHLSNVHRVITRLSCQTRMTSASTTGDHPLSQIRKIVCQSVSEVARHSPIIVCGDPGSGKTSLLSQVFTQSQEWLEESRGPETEVVRIVRLLARSPTSSYAPELLRSLCQQMCLELHHLLEMQDLLTDCETSLTSRFQEVIRMMESSADSNAHLILILDDLHSLKSIQTSSILSWLPWTLPANVHLICSVTSTAESVLSILRTRISNDYFINLTPPTVDSAILMLHDMMQQRKVRLTTDSWSVVRSKIRSLHSTRVQATKRTISRTDSVAESKDPPLPSNDQKEEGVQQVVVVTPLFLDLLSGVVLSNFPADDSEDGTDNLPVLKETDIPESTSDLVNHVLQDLESQFGRVLVSKLCLYIGLTRYGFRETEILELISTEQEVTYEATWFKIKSVLCRNGECDGTGLLQESHVLGRTYFSWSHDVVTDAVRQRYLVSSSSSSKDCLTTHVHSELAHAFFLGFKESLLTLEETTSKKSITMTTMGGMSGVHGSQEHSDVLRELDELWFHLMMSGNLKHLKRDAVLSIDFLMNAVRSASIHYVRSILELVTGHALDFEIELVYNMVRHSMTAVSLDPNQLAPEILMWLQPFSSFSSSSSCLDAGSTTTSPTTFSALISGLSDQELQSRTLFLDRLLHETRTWCLNQSVPILVPINSWLHLPLPSQVRTITLSWKNSARALLTPDSQHIIACSGSQFFLYHLASRRLKQSFQEASTISCICLSRSGRVFASGSSDHSVKVWQANLDASSEASFSQRFTVRSSSSAILCLEISASEKILVSGSENGSVCVVDLETGSVMGRITQHTGKGMVTSIRMNTGDDVFVCGCTDGTLSVWSLDSCHFLNLMTLNRPVFLIDISLDSTFLLAVTQDNRIHVRSLATGTEIHCLDHAKDCMVSSARFAQDCQRVVIGSGDGRLLIYDVFSTRLLTTLNAHSEMISCIITTPADRFLLTCGSSKLIIWNFSPKSSISSPHYQSHQRQSSLPLQANTNAGTTTSSMTTSNSSTTDQVMQQQQQQQQLSLSVASSSRASSTTPTPITSYTRYSRPTSKKGIKRVDNHAEPITCVAVSRDGSLAVTGSKDSRVKVWSSSTAETQVTLEGHAAAITCVAFSPNGQFVVSGSEDKSIRVWSLSMGSMLSSFCMHTSKVLSVHVTNDSKKILSVDEGGSHRLWVADTGQQVFAVNKPTGRTSLHGNNVFAVCGKNGNSLKFWSLHDVESEKTVSHPEAITCFTCTYDGTTLVTGSQDMSLKVWEVETGKITQVLVGHEAGVLCVHIPALKPNLIISGSGDCNAIVWDMNTGTEMFTLSGHTASVSSARLAIDGSLALTAGDDNLLMLWSEKGQRIGLLDLHHAYTSLAPALNTDNVILHLNHSQLLAVIKLHNNPAKGKTIDLPVVGTPPITGDKTLRDFSWRGVIPGSKKHLLLGPGRSLKREQSFDSFYFESMNRGVSVDDFRKLTALTHASSPTGSREHLSTTGIIWDGGSPVTAVAGGGGISPSILPSDRVMPGFASRMRMKLGPKQKVLKKQMSMFAFFPEAGSPCCPTCSAATATAATPSPSASAVSSTTGGPFSFLRSSAAAASGLTVSASHLPEGCARGIKSGAKASPPVTTGHAAKSSQPPLQLMSGRTGLLRGDPPSRSQSLDEAAEAEVEDEESGSSSEDDDDGEDDAGKDEGPVDDGRQTNAETGQPHDDGDDCRDDVDDNGRNRLIVSQGASADRETGSKMDESEECTASSSLLLAEESAPPSQPSAGKETDGKDGS